jgi:hypothetical protein
MLLKLSFADLAPVLGFLPSAAANASEAEVPSVIKDCLLSGSSSAGEKSREANACRFRIGALSLELDVDVVDWEEPSPCNEDGFVEDWEEVESDARLELFSPRPEAKLRLEKLNNANPVSGIDRPGELKE